MGRVDGKTCIVTGAASGIGQATARLLAREGATVVVADVNEADGRKTAEEIGAPSIFVAHDVTDEDAWRSLIADTENRFGQLDVLVNNAGIVVVADIEETKLEDYQRILAVHAQGPFLGCKHAIPAMARAGGGSIINISSVAGLVGSPPYAAYSASKGAVRSITQTVAVHCVQKGNRVRCNSIHPGGINTPMVHALPPEGEGSAPPPEALGQPEDVAAMVLYLASDESRFVNGAALAIDAGFTAA